MAATVGMRDSYHSAALGKAMLGLLDEGAIRERVGDEPFAQKTTTTCRNYSELFSDLKEVRNCGYAIDDEENEPGARCVASGIS